MIYPNIPWCMNTVRRLGKQAIKPIHRTIKVFVWCACMSGEAIMGTKIITLTHSLQFQNKISLKKWRHNGRNGVSNHQPHDCLLLNRLFRRRSKKTSKLRVTSLCAGINRWSVNSQHKWPVTRKMFPFVDVIMPRWSATLITLAYNSYSLFSPYNYANFITIFH